MACRADDPKVAAERAIRFCINAAEQIGEPVVLEAIREALVSEILGVSPPGSPK